MLAAVVQHVILPTEGSTVVAMNGDPRDPESDKWARMDAVEKIEWMIETNGWALEPVAPNAEAVPPTPAYAYTIGLPALTGFAELAVFGLTPVAANGLIGLVIDALQGGTEIPVGTELVGLFDNDLRCYFAPIDPANAVSWFSTAHAWYRGETFDVVQLLFPDRNGFMPYEPGFEQRMRRAQPVVGTVA